MPRKEVVKVEAAAANPNLSLATKFGNLVFVAGQTGRHPFASRRATSSSESRSSWRRPAPRSTAC